MVDNNIKTPKNSPRAKCRLYLDIANIAANDNLPLSRAQLHYLERVLRLQEGDLLEIFNGRSGQFLAELISANNGKFLRVLERQAIQPSIIMGASLAFCPMRRSRLSFMVEKAVELGVTEFYPILSDYTQHKLPSPSRLSRITIEAAEQCGRLDIPVWHDIQKLPSFLANFTGNIIYCAEKGEAVYLGDYFSKQQESASPESASPESAKSVFVIGAEGGFSNSEFALLASYGIAVSLGKNLLRSETACIVALSFWQAFCGNHLLRPDNVPNRAILDKKA